MTADLIARCRAAIEESDRQHGGGRGQRVVVSRNRALTVVLDGIAGTLALHAPAENQPSNVTAWCRRCCDAWPCPEAGDATASLAAIAEALGVQEGP